MLDPVDPPRGQRLLRFVQTNRRRLGAFVLLVGLLVVGSTLSESFPRDVHLRYRFGPSHATVREAHVTFVRDGEEEQSARFSRPSGFPAGLDHELSLMPGRYEVQVTLRDDQGARHLARGLRVPTDGVVSLDLFEPSWGGRAAIGGLQ
ncbi:MAG: hypothetical protein KF901_06265 [Myxococcales bacterium]|nr:hypothetical protein [Myxococcales bacterium]